MNEECPYHAYLLRLWQANNEEHPDWRFSLENAHTSERHGFADFATLLTFLKEQIQGEAVDSFDPVVGDGQ